MISRANLEFIRDTAAAYAGLNVDIDKEFIIESRLMPLARSKGISSANELIRMMQQGTIPDSAQLLSENLADTETYFFRDIRPFETLRQNVLPSLIEKRASQKRLAIWCPGGSTGQEPYSLALLIHEYFPDLLSWNLEISACDLSLEAAEAGASGAYNQIEVNRGLPLHLTRKFVVPFSFLLPVASVASPTPSQLIGANPRRCFRPRVLRRISSPNSLPTGRLNGWLGPG